MTAILYPVADTGEAALHAPKGYAAREREASQVAAGEVAFVTEAVGPAFATREAALDAYAGRVDDERPGRIAQAMDQRWCQLRAMSAGPGVPTPKPRKPVRPAFRDGRRWPAPEASPAQPTLWRLSVSYWRVTAPGASADGQARRLRRDLAGCDSDGHSLGAHTLNAQTLNALARQPLRPAKPQQPLDIGLFEVRLPESPDIIVPDD